MGGRILSLDFSPRKFNVVIWENPRCICEHFFFKYYILLKVSGIRQGSCPAEIFSLIEQVFSEHLLCTRPCSKTGNVAVSKAERVPDFRLIFRGESK